MVKANRLYKRIEPFSVLYWALSIVLAHMLHVGDPAHQPDGRGQLGWIWVKKHLPPPLFLSRCTYSLSGSKHSHLLRVPRVHVGNRLLRHIRVEWFLEKKLGTKQVESNRLRTPNPKFFFEITWYRASEMLTATLKCNNNKKLFHIFKGWL